MPWEPITPSREGEAKEFARQYDKRARFLLDENMPDGLAEGIKALGWNSCTVSVLRVSGRRDEDVLALAKKTDRILLTSDRDFRDERRFPPHRNPGVVILPHGSRGSHAGAPLIAALVAVLPLVGNYRESFRGAVVEVDGSGVFTITDRDFDTGARTAKRYRFARTGRLERWVD